MVFDSMCCMHQCLITINCFQHMSWIYPNALNMFLVRLKTHSALHILSVGGNYPMFLCVFIILKKCNKTLYESILYIANVDCSALSFDYKEFFCRGMGFGVLLLYIFIHNSCYLGVLSWLLIYFSILGTFANYRKKKTVMLI